SGRLTGIRYNDKPLTTKPLLPSITYHYSGKDLTGLLIEYRGREIEYQIDRQGRIRSITIDRDKGIGYSYDDKGRLSAIHLADGRWIEYRYTAPDSGTKAITQLFRPSY
ncbi:MAG: hypothetical protein ACE5EA_11180, partial [Nitrospirota bacterium]